MSSEKIGYKVGFPKPKQVISYIKLKEIEYRIRISQQKDQKSNILVCSCFEESHRSINLHILETEKATLKCSLWFNFSMFSSLATYVLISRKFLVIQFPVQCNLQNGKGTHILEVTVK